MIHEKTVSVQSSLDDAATDAALLASFDTIKGDYRALAEQLVKTRCSTERRRLLSRQRAVFRAALTLTFAQAERDVEASVQR